MTEADWLAATDPAPMMIFLRGRMCGRKLRLFAVACCRKIWPIYRGKLSCRGVVLAERLADGLPIQEHLREFRSSLNYEGFREIDGYRQEKANNVQWHLALAAYNALQDSPADQPGVQPPSVVEFLERRRAGTLDAPAGGLLQAPIVEPIPMSIEAWVPPDVTLSWVDCAWAVAHSCRRSDSVPATRADMLREAREQVPLAHDIFGNPFRPVALDPSWRTEAVVALASGIYADRAFERMPVLADALDDAGCDHADILNHCRGDGPHVRGCWVVDLLLGKA